MGSERMQKYNGFSVFFLVLSEKFLVKVCNEGFSSYVEKSSDSLFTVRGGKFRVCFALPPCFHQRPLLFTGTGQRRSGQGSVSGRTSGARWSSDLYRIVEEAAQSDVS